MTESVGDQAPVVVGVSPSAGGTVALRFACEEARLRRTSLLAVRSWGDVSLMTAGIGYHMSGVPDCQGMARETLAKCLRMARAEFPDLSITTRVGHQRTERALLDAAEGATLLVVGCRDADDHR